MTRGKRLLAASALVAVAIPGFLPVASGAAAAVPDHSAAPVAQNCKNNVVPGKPLTSTPWAQDQLDLAAVSAVSTGRYTSSGRAANGWRYHAGQPVTVATIDSGFDPRNTVLRGADASPARQIGATFRFDDCAGHGTEVGSIIVAQPGSTYMTGIAPGVHLLPIQYTDGTDQAPASAEARSIAYALAQHAQVINMSLQSPARPTGYLLHEFQEAERQGVVIVAAGGNDNPQTGGRRTYYPAALSTSMSNVIAVSPVDQNGVVGDFGISGRYIDVAAPGVQVAVAERLSGFGYVKGSSFAAPFVAGTVALILATHPDLTPAQVRHRLEVTADPPPGSVPDASYGYGTVDPLLAVTSAENDTVSPPAAHARGRELAAPAPPSAPDRSLQHRALAIAFVLLGLAVLTVVGAAVLRGSRRTSRR